VFEPYVEAFASWLELPVSPITHLMDGLAKMETPMSLHDVSFEEVLLELVPSWVGKGTQLPELLFAKPQQLTKVEIKKVPSWNEKSTQLLPKKIWYVVAVLALCGQPTSFGMLMEFFQYKNRNTFRENYLNPLKRLGYLAATKPEVPNSPDNKYFLTDLGRAFLMGR
jgi:ATP-dependent DNA helicase RecG